MAVLMLMGIALFLGGLILMVLHSRPQLQPVPIPIRDERGALDFAPTVISSETELHATVADVLRYIDAYEHGHFIPEQSGVVAVVKEGTTRELDLHNKADRDWLRKTLSNSSH